LTTVFVLLCLWNVIKEDKIKSNSTLSKHDTIVSDVIRPETSVANNEYSFEPSVSVIEGTLITRLYYGQPGYGEDPNNDAKEYPFILKLDKPIKVIAKESDLINSSKSGVKEIQVVPINEDDIKIVRQYLNNHKHIKIQGTLFSAHTGHHHTDVLIEVKKVLD
jgi:hypothetical protein